MTDKSVDLEVILFVYRWRKRLIGGWWLIAGACWLMAADRLMVGGWLMVGDS
jgi:hypothetical protein